MKHHQAHCRLNTQKTELKEKQEDKEQEGEEDDEV